MPEEKEKASEKDPGVKTPVDDRDELSEGDFEKVAGGSTGTIPPTDTGCTARWPHC